MRYHYEKPSICLPIYGELYICNHPVYDRCTLFRDGEKGLAVIQQRYDVDTKRTYWTEVDSWVANDIYLNQGFREYFSKRCGESKELLYPTVSVRQIMWALRMRPLKRERWETVFDRKDI